MACRTFIILALVASLASAQGQFATQDIWALDSANSTIRVLTGAGQITAQTITLQGSGVARGLGFGPTGLCYVARGNDVRTYDGTTTAVFADAADGIDQAQDVAVRPTMAGEVWVASGTTAATSKIIRFDSMGAVIQTLTNSGLNHPRRICWDSTGATLYVASNGNSRIYSVAAATGTFTQVADLTSSMVAPIGVSYDATRNALWVVGDFGGHGDVGLVTLPGGTYTTVIMESQFTGLSAAANVWFDRFRTLNVVARGLNGGTAGLYRFQAQSGSTVMHLTDVTVSGSVSWIDLEGRPELIGIGAPSSTPGNYILNASASAPVPISNPITFSAPRAANQIYAAALSPRWQSSCSPYIPGVYEAALVIGGSDARGVPLSLADGGLLVQATAGVCCVGLTGFPVNQFITVSGFVGTLDPSGNASATINVQPNPPAVLNGFQMSLAFMTVDPTVPSGFGRISDAICLTINVGP